MAALMREKFQHHHHLDDESSMKLWTEARFIFDTSSLLNIYRYNDKTRLDFFKTIKFLEQRLWVPHQVAKEFYNNRINVILDQKKKYSELTETLDLSLKSLRDGKFLKSAFLNVEDIEKAIKPGIEKARKIIEDQKSKHPDLILKDPYLEEIANIIGENIGDEPSCDEFKQLCTQAEERVVNKIPPGYLDNQKPSPQKFGDALIWFEILKYAKTHQHSIIFITDDDKEDWWLKVEGKKLGPRPELREEIKKASGMDFHIINPAFLLEHAEKRLKISISKESIINATTISDELNSVRDQSQQDSDNLLNQIDSNIYKYWSTIKSESNSINKLISNAVFTWLQSEFNNSTIHKGYGHIDYIIEDNLKTMGVRIVQLIDTKYLFLRSTISKINDNIVEYIYKEKLDNFMLIFVLATEKQALTALDQIVALKEYNSSSNLVVGFIDKYPRFIKIN